MRRRGASTPTSVDRPARDGSRISVGVAIAGSASDVRDAALAHADLALYEAKAAGRNRARLFCPAQYREAAQRVSLLQRVGAALDEGTMQL